MIPSPMPGQMGMPGQMMPQQMMPQQMMQNQMQNQMMNPMMNPMMMNPMMTNPYMNQMPQQGHTSPMPNQMPMAGPGMMPMNMGMPSPTSPAPAPIQHQPVFNYEEKIAFQSGVWVQPGPLAPIPHYTRIITTPNLATLQVTLHIPFVGSEGSGNRARLILKVDGSPICDSTKYNTYEWELHPVTLTGLVSNVSAGPHRVELWCQTDRARFHCPHYNTDLIEATVEPHIFATFFLLGFPTSGPLSMPMPTGGPFTYEEKIPMSRNVEVPSGQGLVEVPKYTRTITTPALNCLQLTMHIPFVGNDGDSARSRIVLYFDGQPVCDATKYNTKAWELHEVTLTALVRGVFAGPHTVQVRAMADRACLYLPHFNPSLIEATAEPPIFANFFCLGF
eukprot:GAFH01002140.1.p2 GENE.GAFH01002140.1~~GAFH01002140.1.p2  ORF type:complete len:424 (-),score=89.47 GAFH01002140.1:5-1177(-)